MIRSDMLPLGVGKVILTQRLIEQQSPEMMAVVKRQVTEVVAAAGFGPPIKFVWGNFVPEEELAKYEEKNNSYAIFMYFAAAEVACGPAKHS